MKVSFTQFGEEQCEVCDEFRLNEKMHEYDVNREEFQDTVRMKSIANSWKTTLVICVQNMDA